MAPPDNAENLFVFGETTYDITAFQDLLSGRIKGLTDAGKLSSYLQVFTGLVQSVENRLQQLKETKSINEFQQSTLSKDEPKKKRLAGSIGNSRARGSPLKNRITFLKSISYVDRQASSLKFQRPLNHLLFTGYSISLKLMEPHSKLDSDLKVLEHFSNFLRSMRKFKEKALEELKRNAIVPMSSIWMNSFHQYAEENTIGRIQLHDDLLKFTISDGGFEDILSPSQMTNFIQSLTNYLSIQHEVKTEENVAITIELLDFYKRFRSDPYSVLIGFTPTKKVLAQTNSISIQDKKLTRGSLLITRLNYNSNSHSNEEFIFSRFINRFANKVDVLTNQSKNTILSIDIADCFELSEELENEIINCEFPKSNKFIENPIDEFFRNLMFVDAQEAIYKYLREKKQLNVNLIISKSKLLSESYEIRKSKDQLESILQSVPSCLLAAIQTVVDRKFYEYVVYRDPETIFKGSFLQSYNEIQQVPTASIQATIRRLIGWCNETIDQMKLNKRDLLNGERKKILVEWWLSEIHDDVHRFLDNLNFKHEAIPNNYCDQPPANMDHVKSNYLTLRNIINRLNANYDSTPIMEGLKKRIYPEIDNFLLDSLAVLSAEFGSDVRDLDMKQLYSLFQSKAPAIEDVHLRKWIDGTIKDIEYLTEMKSLEDEEYAKLHPSFHIVPVSGLVMSTFIRFENEHKTVLELWDPKADLIQSSANNNNNNNVINGSEDNNASSHPIQPRSTLSSSSSLPNLISEGGIYLKEFQNAVMDGKIKLAETIIEKAKSKKIDINQKDSKYGWTALHCAATEGQFRLCRLILKLFSSEINVNITNKDGNSALHYVVRHRPNNEKDIELQSSVIKRLISLGIDVNLQNNGGETALHAACYRGNFKAVTILLNANANPNFITKDGHESCLHYAIRSKSPQVITKLIEAGADVAAVSILGETPMDIAIKIGSEVIINALQEGLLNSYK